MASEKRSKYKFTDLQKRAILRKLPENIRQLVHENQLSIDDIVNIVDTYDLLELIHAHIPDDIQQEHDARFTKIKDMVTDEDLKDSSISSILTVLTLKNVDSLLNSQKNTEILDKAYADQLSKLREVETFQEDLQEYLQ